MAARSRRRRSTTITCVAPDGIIGSTSRSPTRNTIRTLRRPATAIIAASGRSSLQSEAGVAHHADDVGRRPGAPLARPATAQPPSTTPPTSGSSPTSTPASSSLNEHDLHARRLPAPDELDAYVHVSYKFATGDGFRPSLCRASATSPPTCSGLDRSHDIVQPNAFVTVNGVEVSGSPSPLRQVRHDRFRRRQATAPPPCQVSDLAWTFGAGLSRTIQDNWRCRSRRSTSAVARGFRQLQVRRQNAVSLAGAIAVHDYQHRPVEHDVSHRV